MPIWIEAGEYCTIKESASILGISRTTIRRIIERGELVVLRINCRCQIIAKSQLTKYEAELDVEP